ncbi:glycosyltransferase family 2 protein [bacterium]|nr:glycosyltransferase family 2 protein [bacterium]
MTVAVIIPALNEEASIARVLEQIPREDVLEILVADNGSTDRTADLAHEGGARVIPVPRRGYGYACLEALRHLSPQVDTVAFMDADGSDFPEELSKLLQPLMNGQAELVVGSRISGESLPGALQVHQYWGNRLACALIGQLYGARVTDLGPFRVIRRGLLERLAMQPAAYRWTTEMLVKALRLGARYQEVPVRYRPRLGESKISGNWKASLFAGLAILSTAVFYAPGLPFYRPVVEKQQT